MTLWGCVCYTHTNECRQWERLLGTHHHLWAAPSSATQQEEGGSAAAKLLLLRST